MPSGEPALSQLRTFATGDSLIVSTLLDLGNEVLEGDVVVAALARRDDVNDAGCDRVEHDKKNYPGQNLADRIRLGVTDLRVPARAPRQGTDATGIQDGQSGPEDE